MRDTLDIECLVEALDQYVEAAHTEREQREQFTGHSWGYFGRDYIERKERAAAALAERLNEYVDERIFQALERVVEQDAMRSPVRSEKKENGR